MTRRRGPEGIPILIVLDPRSSESLTRQIYRTLRDGILAGRLVGGFPLPFTRVLSRDLGVSRNTVVAAFDLVARVVTDQGDAAWIEDPGYHGALGAFMAAGLRVTGVPVDADGLSVVAGRVGAPAARLIYVTPSHQFPLGVTMSLSRRLELLSAAAEMHAWILEDDYDSEFRYVSRPVTALQGLDAEGRVVYVGTFSKVMFPALRVGFVIAPSSLLPALAAARQFAGTQQAALEQMALADFITEGHFERHIRRMRAVYSERQEDLIAALRSECKGLVDASPAGAGMHLVGWLPPGIDAAEVSRRAAVRAVDAIPLSAFAIDRGTARPGLVLGYAHVDRATLFSAARRLAGAIRESLGHRQSRQGSVWESR